MKARRLRLHAGYDLPHIKKLSTPALLSERHGASLACLLRTELVLLLILQGRLMVRFGCLEFVLILVTVLERTSYFDQAQIGEKMQRRRSQQPIA
jgi:hypothetical protein